MNHLTLANINSTPLSQELSSIPVSGNPTRQGRLNQERVDVTPLSSNSTEIPATSDAGPSTVMLPPRSEITAAPVSPDEITAIFHEENDLKTSKLLAQQTRQPSTSSLENVSESKLKLLLAKMDAAVALGQFQNNRYLAQERLPANLPQFRASVKALHMTVQNPAIPQKERDELTRLTLDLMHKIDRVSTDKSQGPKVAMKLFFAMASVGLCLLPLLTARKNNDNQYLALLVAGYAKTMLMLIGLTLSRTADAQSFTDHLKERHVPYLVPTLPYALSAYNAHAKEFEHEHPLAFHGTAAAFTGTIFLLTSAPHLVTGPLNAMYQKIKDHLSGNPGTGTSAPPEALAVQLENEISSLTDTFRTHHAAMMQRRDEFEKSGNQLSDALSTQVSDIDFAAMKLDDSLSKLLGNDAPGAIVRANDDQSRKMAFTVLAAFLCLGSAATYYDEPVGLIDLGMDAGLAIGELAKTALNPAETTQRAAEKFSSYSGLAPLLLGFGVLNKIPATHFTDSAAGLVIGTILLTCGNLTLPRPGAEALSQMILKLMDSVKAAHGGRPEIDEESGFKMPENAGCRITELTDAVDSGLPASGSDAHATTKIADGSAPDMAIETAASKTAQTEQSAPQPEADKIEIVVDRGDA